MERPAGLARRFGLPGTSPALAARALALGMLRTPRVASWMNPGQTNEVLCRERWFGKGFLGPPRLSAAALVSGCCSAWVKEVPAVRGGSPAPATARPQASAPFGGTNTQVPRLFGSPQVPATREEPHVSPEKLPKSAPPARGGCWRQSVRLRAEITSGPFPPLRDTSPAARPPHPTVQPAQRQQPFTVPARGSSVTSSRPI